MAIKSIEKLKGYFRRGMYPTEEQFGDLVDSMRHRSELLALADVEGLTRALNGKLGTEEAERLERSVKVATRTASVAAEEASRAREALDELSDARRVCLSVDADAGALVVHGAGPLLSAGLTPVLFRCLRRHSRDTGLERHSTRRWVRFSKQRDAVRVDVDSGVVSFSRDLLSQEAGRPEAVAWGTVADVLVLDHKGGIRYGRTLLRLEDTQKLRMLYLRFALAFVDDSKDWPARRTTAADAAVWLPFGVRYTPVFIYNGAVEDDGGLSRVEHGFSFELKDV